MIPPSTGKPGVNVVGYLRSETGVGEAARTLVRALRRAGHPVACTSVHSPDGARQDDHSLGPLDDAPVHDISLFCVNASEVPSVRHELGPAFFSTRHNVGMWFWELERFPAGEPALGAFQEIWTASRFVQRAISDVAAVPVVNVRLPVTPPPASANPRAQFGLPDDRRIVLFVFDALSVVERKNPLALVDAYERAFGRRSQTALLVVKASRLDLFPDARADVREAVSSVGGVLIDRYLDRAGLAALFHACDVYVSLHRSEGFGLTLAEAMAIGKPVVATAYSGNLDFMTASNSLLVRHGLTRVGEGQGPYPASSVWADPDVDHAAECLARLVEDRPAAATLGRRGASDIAATHGLDTVGALLSARVSAIQAHRAARRPS